MLVRDGLHYYERCLIGAIEKPDDDEAVHIIARFRAYNEPGARPRLTLSHHGLNFLQRSVEKSRSDKVAHALLETHEFDAQPDILFSVDASGQTLICKATQKGYLAVVRKLHALNLTHLQGSRIWHKADHTQKTPLHYAVATANDALITFFTDLIKDESDCTTLINTEDNVGDTPLHYAIRQNLDKAIVRKLLICGADMGRLNHHRISPFGLLCEKDENTQIAWLRKLDKKDDDLKLLPSVLACYKDYLISHPHDKKISRVYYTVIGAQEKEYEATETHPPQNSHLGLTALAVAHLEVNPKVKIRNLYHSYERVDGFRLKLMYRLIPTDERILRDSTQNHDDILYLYLEHDKIKFAIMDANGIIQRICINDDLQELNTGVYWPIKEVLQDVEMRKQLERKELEALADVTLHYEFEFLIPPYRTRKERKFIEYTKTWNPELAGLLPNYLAKLSERGIFAFKKKPIPVTASPEQIFSQDRNTFSALISDIETYIQAIALRQPVNIHRKIAVIVPLVSWLVYGGIEAYLIFKRFTEQPTLTYKDTIVPLMERWKMPEVVLNIPFIGTWCEKIGSDYYAYAYKTLEEVYYEKTQLGDCIDIQKWVYYWSSVGFGVLGSVLNCVLTIALPCNLWSKKTVVTISPSEWQEILQTLQKNILEKIEKLNDSDIPVNPASINELADFSTQFNDSKTKDETIEIFTRLINLLERLRTEMDHSHKAFSSSLYAPTPQDREVVIEFPSPSSSSSEETSYSEEFNFSAASPQLDNDVESPLIGDHMMIALPEEVDDVESPSIDSRIMSPLAL